MNTVRHPDPGAAAVISVIFDLDGTLIDSAPSILAGFGQALRLAGVTPVRPLSADLIGPPLQQALGLLSGSSDSALLAQLAQHFKAYYDEAGYRLSVVYPGVTDALRTLHAQGVQVHLATNKRHAPTLLILEHLGWLPWFRSVYALDMAGLGLRDKTQMVAAQLRNEGIAAANAWYVGDRREDREAARNNAIGFIGVDWGYDRFEADSGHAVLSAMDALPPLLTATVD